MSTRTRVLQDMKNFSHIGTTCVWNCHQTKLRDSRNVKNHVQKLFGEHIEMAAIHAVVVARGRTQHSASCVYLFDVTSDPLAKADLYLAETFTRDNINRRE
jgi:hypothetical protein